MTETHDDYQARLIYTAKRLEEAEKLLEQTRKTLVLVIDNARDLLIHAPRLFRDVSAQAHAIITFQTEAQE